MYVTPARRPTTTAPSAQLPALFQMVQCAVGMVTAVRVFASASGMTLSLPTITVIPPATCFRSLGLDLRLGSVVSAPVSTATTLSSLIPHVRGRVLGTFQTWESYVMAMANVMKENPTPDSVTVTLATPALHASLPASPATSPQIPVVASYEASATSVEMILETPSLSAHVGRRMLAVHVRSTAPLLMVMCVQTMAHVMPMGFVSVPKASLEPPVVLAATATQTTETATTLHVRPLRGLQMDVVSATVIPTYLDCAMSVSMEPKEIIVMVSV